MTKKKKEKEYYIIDGYKVPKYPPLSHEETLELLKKYRNGDKEAGNKIVEHCYGLAIKECSTYKNNRIPKLELFQEGCIGIIMALDKYDFETGNRFSTCATWWIKNRITNYAEKQSYGISIGREVYRLINKIKYYEDQMSINLGRPVTDEELAKELDIDVDKLVYIKQISNGEVSLEKQDDEKHVSLYELVQSNDLSLEDLAENEERKRLLLQAIDSVCTNEKEKTIILKRFGFYDGKIYTLKSLGDEFGLKHETVRQSEKRILRRIKKYCNEHMKPYIES